MSWIVKAKEGEPSNGIRRNWPWGEGFFPREFHYKIDALKMMDSVHSHGGTATVEKKLKTSKS